MELIVSPLISPVFLALFGLLLGLIVFWFESNDSSRIVFLIVVLLLVGIGFRPSLVEETQIPPDRPISIVYENSSRAERLGISRKAGELSQQLKDRISEENIILRPMDNRWPEPPTFRDYNQFKRTVTPLDPIQVIVGEGLHTSPTDPPELESPEHFSRALWNPVSTTDTSSAQISVERAVHLLSQPEPVDWSVQVRNLEPGIEYDLVLRDQQSIHQRVSDQISDDRSVKLSYTAQEEQNLHLTAELLRDGEDTLPVGHPRRVELGILMESDAAEILIVDRRPHWRSGWWGRKARGIESWDIHYHYRESDQLGKQERASPDVTMYFGLPKTQQENARFEDLRENSGAFLLVFDGPPGRTASVEALESMGLPAGGSYSLQQGEFFPRFLEDTVDRVPGIGGMKLLFENGPPIGRLTLAPQTPESYHSVLETEQGSLVWWNSQQNYAVFFSDRFHRWGMRWGRLRNPEAGSQWVREWLGHMVRSASSAQSTLISRTHATAGERVKYDLSRVEGRLRIRPERGNDRFVEPGDPLVFGQPGLFRIDKPDADDDNEFHTMFVSVPEAERTGKGAVDIMSIIEELRTFKSKDELIEWVNQTWQDRHRVEQTTVFPWNHPAVLLLIVGLITVGWWLRDRTAGEAR